MFSALLALAAVIASVRAAPPTPVSSIDLSKYTGAWYQIADFPQFYEIFCSKCTMANYTALSNGHINVVNSCRSTPSSKPTTIKGDASVPDKTKPGELVVKFFDGLSSGQYWVIALGDVNQQNQYDWAVVSDENRLTLYVLSRAPVLSNSTQATVLDFVKKNGFDVDKLRYTDQASCGWNGGRVIEHVPALIAPLATNTTLYKIESGRCGQSTLNSAYAGAAKAFAGLKDGTCPEQGYTVADGGTTMKVPVIGSVKIEYFKKLNAISDPVCKKDEYCCPDAKHCLQPTALACDPSAAKSVCAPGQACCPLTHLCVNVGASCKSPCQDQNSYCCPDALHCLTPTNPGKLCTGPGTQGSCAAHEVCCPVTNECVSVGAACNPP